MSLPRRVAALALAAAVGTGCSLAAAPAAPPSPSDAPTTPAPTAGPPSATASAGPTASGAPGTPTLDLTRPGAARELVDDLLEAAGAQRAIMTTVTPTGASVTVLHAGQPETWAWRDGRIQQVPSDITYVAQHSFDPADFAFDDVGALFRLAEAVSGSRQEQSLQIVDYSGGLVSMSVSTNPESRAVFFRPDGTLLPTLDFTSAWGLREGFQDAVGERRVATAVGFSSTQGVHLDAPRRADGGIDRRQRTARTPVLVTPRAESPALDRFDPSLVDPDVVWGVLDELHDQDAFSLDTPWECVVDTRAGSRRPRLHFTVGERSFVTDLSGRVVPS